MTSSELDFKKYLNLINRKKRLFAVIALTIMTLAVIISYVLPKKYAAESTVFIEKNVVTDLVKGIAVTPSMEDSLKVLTHTLSSRTLLLKVVNELDLNVSLKSDAEIEGLIKQLQYMTYVKVKDKEGLFTIAFQHEDPRFARDYVNTLVRVYIEENISSKRGESYGATKFLSEQITTFKEKKDKAEAAVNKFKSDKGGMVNLDEGRLLQDISNAQQKLYDLQLRRRLLEGQKSFAKTGVDPLQGRLAALQKRLEELHVEYTDKYPEVIKTKAEIEAAQEQLKARHGMNFAIPLDPQELMKLETELAAIRESEKSLQGNIAANQNMLSSVPAAKADLEKLEAEKENQKTMYDQLFARHDQSEVSKQMELQDKSTTFRIVDPAVTSSKPVSPNRVKIMLMGIVAGLAGGLGFLLLLDYLDHSVKMVGSLKSFGLPVLAVIPLVKSNEAIEQERKKDMRLYYVSGGYFSVIFAIVVIEAFKRYIL